MPSGCPWAENGLTVSTTGTAELMECDRCKVRCADPMLREQGPVTMSHHICRLTVTQLYRELEQGCEASRLMPINLLK
ncbi:hypothetical protein NDU88_003394 [Pleurodeles waltl]|uniref:Uncharacterized protein n=1 Tax=Pleurodeles waltl TaxID=8319 RepID=A0AAV7V0F8_PLEWA|nr:hypothetical protein NDU88_003394 [Pleurodeles waltl]